MGDHFDNYQKLESAKQMDNKSNNHAPQRGKENKIIQESDDFDEAPGNDGKPTSSSSSSSSSSSWLCFACKRSLAKSPQLINLAGQAHRWHPECFKCHVCREPMDGLDSCHLYKEKILCRADYLRLRRDNSAKCSRCRWQIGASDWVRRAGKDYVYHLACFNCDVCSRQLNTGDQFAIDVQQRGRVVRLLCRLHFSINANDAPPKSDECRTTTNSGEADNDHNNNNNNTNTSNDEDDDDDNHPNGGQDDGPAGRLAGSAINQPETSEQATYQAQYQLNMTTSQAQRRQQYLQLLGAPAPGSSSPSAGPALTLNELILSTNAHSDDNKSTQRSSSSKSSSSPTLANQQHQSASIGLSGSKSKRVRTTFTEDQLSILQNHFHIDSNPDGQDLERIATITGLSKRVTQVWFQNSRARQKKYMIKRKPSSNGSSVAGASISGAGNGGGGGGGESIMGAMAAGLSAANSHQVMSRQYLHHPMFDRSSSSMLRTSGPSTTPTSSSSLVVDPHNQANLIQRTTDPLGHNKWPSDHSNQSDYSEDCVEEDQVGEFDSEGRDEDENQEEMEISEDQQSVACTESDESTKPKE